MPTQSENNENQRNFGEVNPEFAVIEREARRKKLFLRLLVPVAFLLSCLLIWKLFGLPWVVGSAVYIALEWLSERIMTPLRRRAFIVLCICLFGFVWTSYYPVGIAVLTLAGMLFQKKAAK